MTSPVPLHSGVFYHIYNRGNNREDVFVEERNYRYFLELYAKHIEPVAETYAYGLLKNHFHLVVRTRDSDGADPSSDPNSDPKGFEKPLGSARDPSQAFSNFFNAYAKAINKAYGRTGSLFQHPFGRIQVQTQSYLMQLVRYVHFNPQKHGLVADFRQWPHTSYHTILSRGQTLLQREAVLGWFGGVDEFLAARQMPPDERIMRPLSTDDFD